MSRSTFPKTGRRGGPGENALCALRFAEPSAKESKRGPGTQMVRSLTLTIILHQDNVSAEGIELGIKNRFLVGR